MDWQALDLTALRDELHSALPTPEAERMVWAFEHALGVARIDGDLLDYLLAATACLLAQSSDTTPRGVLEAFFRRSVGDDEWRRRYAPLLESGSTEPCHSPEHSGPTVP